MCRHGSIPGAKSLQPFLSVKDRQPQADDAEEQVAERQGDARGPVDVTAEAGSPRKGNSGSVRNGPPATMTLMIAVPKPTAKRARYPGRDTLRADDGGGLLCGADCAFQQRVQRNEGPLAQPVDFVRDDAWTQPSLPPPP